MKVIVIGGSGHIGTYLVPMLVNNGYEVTNITRGQHKPYEDNSGWDKVKSIVLDRKSENFEKNIAEQNADIVIDLINFNINDTVNIAEALKKTNCKHYLYCSSCWARGVADCLPFKSGEETGTPLCAYGKDKLASERYLCEQYKQNGFPATCIRPGQISGAGWDIISPWGNLSKEPFKRIAKGEEIYLPNFGMETIHHVHAYDVAQVFYNAVTYRENALGEVFEAASGASVTLYGYAKLMYEFFGKEPEIKFLSWDKWCEYEGNAEECEHTYLHIARSGCYDIEKEKLLLNYKPKYTNIETIKLAVQSYIDRGLI